LVAAVDLDAGEFRYTEYGDPGAPPLVLHGESARTATYSLEEMREDL